MKKPILALTAVIVILLGYYAYVRVDRSNGPVAGGPGREAATTTAGGPSQVPAAASTTAERQYVNVYYIDLGSDGGVAGKSVGCGDRVIPWRVEVAPTQGVIKAALTKLFTLDIDWTAVELDAAAEKSDFYNALKPSSGLTVESANVEGGVATVRLSGKLVSGGVCDDPRIVAQIKETVEQFPTVKSSKIFINNKPLETYFSER